MSVLTPSQTFEEKMMERMKASMGDLMPDDVLKKLMEKAIDKAFNSPTELKDEYGRAIKSSESWLQTFLRVELESRMQVLAKEWITENKEQVLKLVSDKLDLDVATMFASGFTQLFQSSLFNIRNEITTALSRIH